MRKRLFVVSFHIDGDEQLLARLFGFVIHANRFAAPHSICTRAIGGPPIEFHRAIVGLVISFGRQKLEILLANFDGRSHEIVHANGIVVAQPITPAEPVVFVIGRIAIGIVIAVLRAHVFVAAQYHRATLAKQQ